MSLSLQVRETARWARDLLVSCMERYPEPGGQQDRQNPQFSQAELPAADAKGDHHGLEPLSGVWNSAVSAVGWNLPQLYLESGVLHPSGSLDRCLGTPETKWGISPGACLWVDPLSRPGCSDHVCRYLRCVSLPDVSDVTWVVSLLNQSAVADWQSSWLT